MKVGKFIKEARIKKGLTLEAVAKQLGINFTTLSRIESGDRNISKYSKKLAKILDVPESEIQTMYLTSVIIKQHGKNPYLLPALERVVLIKQKK